MVVSLFLHAFISRPGILSVQINDADAPLSNTRLIPLVWPWSCMNMKIGLVFELMTFDILLPSISSSSWFAKRGISCWVTRTFSVIALIWWFLFSTMSFDVWLSLFMDFNHNETFSLLSSWSFEMRHVSMLNFFRVSCRFARAGPFSFFLWSEH